MTQNKKKRNFLMPREGFLDFLNEFANEYCPEEAKKISIEKAYEFIDKFTAKHFMDDDDLAI
jgi:hypothetical protein